MTAADLESPRPAGRPGFSDAVTVSFGDPQAELYGLVRVGLIPNSSSARASGLALLFRGREVAAARALPAVEVAEPGYAPPELDGVGIETVERLRRWRARFDDAEGGFDLDVSALGPPLAPEEDDPAGELSGSRGYEQLCRLEGVVRAGGAERRVSCFGQRGHTWGAPDWDRIALTRAVSVWLGEEGGLTLSAVRPSRAGGHSDEAVSALLAEPADDGLAPRPLAETRLSTTYDAEGHQRRAGIELWESEESEYPRRVSGAVACGTSLSLGRLRLDCAFFHWHLDGRPGVGRYDVLRRDG